MFIEEKLSELYSNMQELRSKLEQLTETVTEKVVLNAYDVAEYTGFKSATVLKIMREAGGSVVNGKRFVNRCDLELYLMSNREMSANELKQAAKIHLYNNKRKLA